MEFCFCVWFFFFFLIWLQIAVFIIQPTREPFYRHPNKKALIIFLKQIRNNLPAWPCLGDLLVCCFLVGLCIIKAAFCCWIQSVWGGTGPLSQRAQHRATAGRAVPCTEPVCLLGHTLGDNDTLGDTAAGSSKREEDNTEDLKNFFSFNLIWSQCIII